MVINVHELRKVTLVRFRVTNSYILKFWIVLVFVPCIDLFSIFVRIYMFFVLLCESGHYVTKCINNDLGDDRVFSDKNLVSTR